MIKWREEVLTPSWWANVFTVLGAVGFLFCVVGALGSIPVLVTIGFVLLVPLFAGGILLVLVVIPVLIWADRKKRGK